MIGVAAVCFCMPRVNVQAGGSWQESSSGAAADDHYDGIGLASSRYQLQDGAPLPGIPTTWAINQSVPEVSKQHRQQQPPAFGCPVHLVQPGSADITSAIRQLQCCWGHMQCQIAGCYAMLHQASLDVLHYCRHFLQISAASQPALLWKPAFK